MVRSAVNADDEATAFSISIEALAKLGCPIFQRWIKLDIDIECCHELVDSEGWKLEGNGRGS